MGSSKRNTEAACLQDETHGLLSPECHSSLFHVQRSASTKPDRNNLCQISRQGSWRRSWSWFWDRGICIEQTFCGYFSPSCACYENCGHEDNQLWMKMDQDSLFGFSEAGNKL